MDEFKASLRESIQKVERWVEVHDYKGYEPFDGMSSIFRPLTFGNLFLDRLLLQLVRQSPINLRPLLGIKPLESTKGRGYMASGYLTMYKATGDPSYREKAALCLEWLIRNKSPKFDNYSWANHFDFASRSGRYPKNESIIVWTALIGQTFLDAYETLDDMKYLDIAVSVCEWIMALPREQTDSGTCISYLAVKQSSIHNSNMLGAAMLARTSKFNGNKDYRQLAGEAINYSCSRQLPDGAWFYGEKENQRWIDNFHTGYNMDSLKCYIESTGDKTYGQNLKKGFQYFIDTFFDRSGRPKYYHNRVYPIDIQCASQAVATLAYFSDYHKDSMEMAIKITNWTIKNMQGPSGCFYYRIYPAIKAKTTMFHWGQATMYKGLALLLSRLN